MWIACSSVSSGAMNILHLSIWSWIWVNFRNSPTVWIWTWQGPAKIERLVRNLQIVTALWQSAIWFWTYEFGASEISLIPIGIFTTTRLPQGNTNSVFIFQRAMDTIFRPVLTSRELLIWIDDLLGHASDTMSLLANLRIVFESCRQFRLKLNATRCRFFLLEAK